MDDGDDFDELYADLVPNRCELNNAGAALDLGGGTQSDDYTSESEDDLCILLNDTERSGSTKREIRGKEGDFGIGDVLEEHGRCEPVGLKGNFNFSMFPSGQGDWDHFRFPYFGGFTDAVENGFNFFLPRNWNIFSVNIGGLNYKPWRKAGANKSDFFNFDFDEDSWKSYCQDLGLLWAKAMMSNWVRHDRSAFIEKKGISKVPEKPKGKAILVRSGFGERVPSTDIWQPCTERDSNVVIHINTTGSMENENNMDTIEAKNPEAEEGEYESALVEHENETMERCFDLQKGDTYCGLDTDFMQYSYNEKEGRGSQIATMDTDSCSEESVEECDLNGVCSSSNQKAEFQSSGYSSSRTEARKVSEVLEKDIDGKNRSSIEVCHESYASVSVGYRNSWSTMKHKSLRYKSRILAFKEEQRAQFARQEAPPGAPWHGKEDKPLLGIQRYQYMDVQDPRNPRSQIRDCYGGSPTGNVKYKTGGYSYRRFLKGQRCPFKQTTLRKGHVLSQKGQYRQHFICGKSYTENKFVRDTFRERCDERQYTRPVNSRLKFQEGFVERGSCNYGSRNATIRRSFLNGRRGYNIDWFDRSNSGGDLTERSYIADNWEERESDLLALRRKEVVNVHFGDDRRKKFSRKGNEIAGNGCSQCIKRPTNCTSNGQDRHPKIPRFERSGPYQAGQANTISRVDRNNKASAKALVKDKSGEIEKIYSERILEAMDKMQKRRERFKELAFTKKGGGGREEKALREVEADSIVDEGKRLRPVRKRMWGCQ